MRRSLRWLRPRWRHANNLRRLTIFVWFIGALGSAAGCRRGLRGDERRRRRQQACSSRWRRCRRWSGASTVAARSRFLRRPWRIDDEHSVAVDYSVRLIVQVILALGAANVAYAGAILTGAPWMVGVGSRVLPAAVVRRRAEPAQPGRVQAELAEAGCRFDLVESLRSGDTV